MDEKPPMEPILREEAGHVRGAFHDHPTPEQLVAFRAGELPAGEVEQIEAHLAACPECEQLLQDLVRFDGFEPAEESVALADRDAQAAWQRLRPKLPVSTLKPFRPREAKPAWKDLRFAYALAAALFFCVVGLAVWGVSQKRLAEQMAAPRLTEVLYLFEDGGTRGGPAEPAERARIPHARSVDIALRTSAAYQDYEVEIVDATGRSVWRDRRRVGEEGSLFLGLTGRSLPPGLYEIQVYGIDGDRKVSLGEHRIEIVSPGPRRP